MIECVFIDGWWTCPTGSKHRALEGGYVNASGWQGKFIIHWGDGGIFEGYYVDNVPSGLGEFLHYNGDHYKGNYEHNARNGFGVYKWVNGNIYEGIGKMALCMDMAMTLRLGKSKKVLIEITSLFWRISHST